MDEVPTPASQLRAQWSNPSDIFSLLLIIGGDVVQRALSHTFGYYVSFSSSNDAFRLYLTPVAFSFGWVAYAFFCLSAVFGEGRLMAEPDTQIQVVNCKNGFVRENHSWTLGRLLRDCEEAAKTDEKVRLAASKFDTDHGLPTTSTDTHGIVSLKIELFELDDARDKPHVGKLWLSCWGVIVIQLVVSAIPWILYEDWAIFMVTGFGTFLALLTGTLPQWRAEKWSAKIIAENTSKIVALTRGNGHTYAMVIIGRAGARDLETMATARIHFHQATKIILALLSALWIVLLITVTGLTDHTWFLILVGGLGMLQNVVVAAAGLTSHEMGIGLTPVASRPVITGYQYTTEERRRLRKSVWNDWSEEKANNELNSTVPEPNVRATMGALMELEKLYSRAGTALLPIFFPGTMQFNETVFVTERDRLFWKTVFTQFDDKVEKERRSGLA